MRVHEVMRYGHGSGRPGRGCMADGTCLGAVGLLSEGRGERDAFVSIPEIVGWAGDVVPTAGRAHGVHREAAGRTRRQRERARVERRPGKRQAVEDRQEIGQARNLI